MGTVTNRARLRTRISPRVFAAWWAPDGAGVSGRRRRYFAASGRRRMLRRVTAGVTWFRGHAAQARGVVARRQSSHQPADRGRAVRIRTHRRGRRVVSDAHSTTELDWIRRHPRHTDTFPAASPQNVRVRQTGATSGRRARREGGRSRRRYRARGDRRSVSPVTVSRQSDEYMPTFMCSWKRVGFSRRVYVYRWTAATERVCRSQHRGDERGDHVTSALGRTDRSPPARERRRYLGSI